MATAVRSCVGRKLPSTVWGDERYYRIRTMLNCTNPGFPKTQLFESRGHGRVLHMPIVRRFGLGQRPAPARFSNYSVQPQAAGQVTCRPCSGNPSTETSNSTADRTALRGTYPDADDPPVEAAEAAVSDLKAPELKPGRRPAHHGGILVLGGLRWEPARVAVAGETRRSAGVGDVRCRPDSRGSGGLGELPHGNEGDPLRSSMIVPAPNVAAPPQAGRFAATPWVRTGAGPGAGGCIGGVCVAMRPGQCPCYALTASRRAFAALKAGAREAAMATASPVSGFRPVRAGRSRVVNFPNPAMATVSPLARASAMLENSASSAAPASAFDSDVAAATCVRSSDRFTASPAFVFGH